MAMRELKTDKLGELVEAVWTEVLGWKWMSYIGIPVKGTDGYPEKCRVRRLFSPKALKSPRWIDHFARNEGRQSDGTEPLDYSYCSSCGPECPPRIRVFVDEDE